MSRTDFHDRAYRRRVAVMLIAFLLALPALFALAAYLLVVYFRPAEGWFDMAMFLLQLLPFIFLSAGGVAIGVTYVVDFPDLLRGRFRCDRCGRVAGRRTVFCRCDFPAQPARRKRPCVHYRRRLKPVLLLYGGILGATLIFLATSPAPRHYPIVVDVLLGHAVLCALVAVLTHLIIAILELLKRGRRWRLRAGLVVRMLAVWPLLVAVAMVVLKTMGWA